MKQYYLDLLAAFVSCFLFHKDSAYNEINIYYKQRKKIFFCKVVNWEFGSHNTWIITESEKKMINFLSFWVYVWLLWQKVGPTQKEVKVLGLNFNPNKDTKTWLLFWYSTMNSLFTVLLTRERKGGVRKICWNHIEQF